MTRTHLQALRRRKALKRQHLRRAKSFHLRLARRRLRRRKLSIPPPGPR